MYQIFSYLSSSQNVNTSTLYEFTPNQIWYPVPDNYFNSNCPIDKTSGIDVDKTSSLDSDKICDVSTGVISESDFYKKLPQDKISLPQIENEDKPTDITADQVVNTTINTELENAKDNFRNKDESTTAIVLITEDKV